jgi:uncharacterized protein (TIGR03435 family)
VRGRLRVVMYLACSVAAGGLLHVAGQTPASTSAVKPPSYDVVTVRPNNQGPGSVRVSTNLDVYAGTNVSLVDLLNDAFNLKPGMLEGEPKWAESNRYDIHGKILDSDEATLKNLKPEDRRRMVREILEDRFHLKFHTESKPLPVYELQAAKDGAKVQPIDAKDKGNAFHDVSPGGTSTNVHNGRGHMVAHYVALDSFCSSLSNQVSRPVINKTGMTGLFNIELNWSRDDAPVAEDDASNFPPLFVAMEEQLGLKLVSAKDPVQIIVVDHVDLPALD